MGCNPPSSETANTSPVSTSLRATTTNFIQLTSTVLPAATLQAVVTPTAMKTPTTIPVTSISLTTLSPDEAETQILELFRDNAGCLFPCWWGITPGLTSWQDAERFLATFASQIQVSSGPAWSFAEVYFSISQGTPTLRQFYTSQNSIVEMIEAHPLDMPQYKLSVIFETYGQPSEVWLLTVKEPIEGALSFRASLFYPNQKFLLAYTGRATKQSDLIQRCLEQDASRLLATWSASEELTYHEVADKMVEFGTPEYDLPLEEATGMTVAAFYESFKDPDNTSCLETPANLWTAP